MQVSFKNRQEAGLLLAHKLKGLDLKKAVVLGILRGGIILAREISRVLNLDLDIVLSRKLGAPGNPELAIGAVTEDGNLFVNKRLALEVGADESYIEQEKAQQLAEIKRRIQRFRGIKAKVNLKARPVIITDDGVATGATMQAALWALRKEEPKKLIVAVPVIANEALEKISREADEMIVLSVPSFFAAVGQFYLEFPQVSDEEVLEILKAVSNP